MAAPSPTNLDELGERRGFTVYENQRWYPIRGWSSSLLPTDRAAFSDRHGKFALSKEGYALPPGYQWITEWEMATETGETDGDGWSYAVDFPASFHEHKSATSMVRRRKWQRLAERRRSAALTGAGDDFVDAGKPVERHADSSPHEAPSPPQQLQICDSDAPLPVQEVQPKPSPAQDHQFESLLAKFAHEDSQA